MSLLVVILEIRFISLLEKKLLVILFLLLFEKINRFKANFISPLWFDRSVGWLILHFLGFAFGNSAAALDSDGREAPKFNFLVLKGNVSEVSSLEMSARVGP